MIIVIMILVILTGMIASIQASIFKRREDIAQEGSFYNAIRFSMNVLQRDVLHLYTPLLASPSPTPSPGAGQGPGGLPGGSADPNDSSGNLTDYWGAAVDATGIRPARLVGSETKLTFVSTSHIRIYRNAQESEFTKVQYELRTDPQTLPDGTPGGGQMLVRAENPNAFDDEERKTRSATASSHTLLHGIKSLRFRYYNGAQARWDNRWDSEAEDTKRIYPEMIEVQVSVLGPSRLFFDGTFLYKPEMPLNGLPATY